MYNVYETNVLVAYIDLNKYWIVVSVKSHDVRWPLVSV